MSYSLTDIQQEIERELKRSEVEVLEMVSKFVGVEIGGGDNMVIFKNDSCNPLDHCSYTTEVWKNP